jgi:SP family general alpha glucoside:H+ symporter-like MFS transporter
MEWYGRKKTFGAGVIATTGCVFIQFFARSLPVLLTGELLGGLVLGTYAVIAPSYASEVCPTALRGILTAYVNLCFVIGQFIANGVIAWTSTYTTHWAYSTPFALQWLWPLIILIGLPFAPESPYWLARKGRMADAEHSLKRLCSPKVDVKPVLALIIETDRLEHEMEAGNTYSDCFKKINRRRTEIAVGVYSIQVISGIYLVGYATYFFECMFSLFSNFFYHTNANQWLDFQLAKLSIWGLDFSGSVFSEPVLAGFSLFTSADVESTTSVSRS